MPARITSRHSGLAHQLDQPIYLNQRLLRIFIALARQALETGDNLHTPLT